VLFKIASIAPPSSADAKIKPKDNMEVEPESSVEGVQGIDGGIPIHDVSKAISSLAKYAPKPFVKNLFKKLMHRLLDDVQSGSESCDHVCSLISLAQALVTSRALDEDNVDFLYRALKPILRGDETKPRAQKRAYKVLAEICEQYHSFVTEPDRLKELTALLTETSMTSQVSARLLRLKCMGIIVA